MTLNAVIAFILHFSPNSTDFQADYITLDEDRPIMAVKYCHICRYSLSQQNSSNDNRRTRAIVYKNSESRLLVQTTGYSTVYI